MSSPLPQMTKKKTVAEKRVVRSPPGTKMAQGRNPVKNQKAGPKRFLISRPSSFDWCVAHIWGVKNLTNGRPQKKIAPPPFPVEAKKRATKKDTHKFLVKVHSTLNPGFCVSSSFVLFQAQKCHRWPQTLSALLPKWGSVLGFPLVSL